MKYFAEFLVLLVLLVLDVIILAAIIGTLIIFGLIFFSTSASDDYPYTWSFVKRVWK